MYYFTEMNQPDLLRCTDLELSQLAIDVRIELERRAAELPEISEDEKCLVNAGRIVGAIKFYRYRTRLGLRQSKSVIDKYRGV